MKTIGLGLLAIILSIITALPVKAAERIFFFVGPLQFSLSVDSLETFAKTGVINRDLSLYLRNATPEELAKFRQVLQKQYPLSPIKVFQFFNTSIGESLLTIIGEAVNIPGGINGKFALRAALIGASQDPQGLSILNVLRNFPMDIQLNIGEIIGKANNIDTLFNATNVAVEKIAKLSNEEAAQIKPVNFAERVEPRKPGEYGYSKETLTLTDTSRQRNFRVIVYKPQRWPSEKVPIVVISHGLASRPEDFEQYAQQLATYGYVVAIPQHPGSDLAQFQAMLQGRSGEVFLIDEFIDRPLDVTYVLDELNRRNESQFEGKLDLNNVGVAGHSFGGYTALALAGAPIDFDRLTQDCAPQFRLPNTSLLLQCRALELPRKTYNFRDRRVKAVLALNSVGSSLFGPQGIGDIQIPVFFYAGTQDLAAPAVLEQIRSFVWLTTPNKYLAVAKGDLHTDVSQLDAGAAALLESIPDLEFADPSLIKAYTYSMMVSFFQVSLRGDDNYRVFLNAKYAQYISVAPFPLFLITSVSSDPLLEYLQTLKR